MSCCETAVKWIPLLFVGSPAINSAFVVIKLSLKMGLLLNVISSLIGGNPLNLTYRS